MASAPRKPRAKREPSDPTPTPAAIVLEDAPAGGTGGNIDPDLVAAIAEAMIARDYAYGKGVVTGLPYTHNLPHDVLTEVRQALGEARHRMEDGKPVSVLGTRKVKRDGGDTFSIVWRRPTEGYVV